jgi:2-polyprenyl-6-methoxyphenol hydroxylase-like FAD-dependent oxidoreductase
MTPNPYNARMVSWKYNVVIVGAGSAGIPAAIALAKADIPVLVIEARLELYCSGRADSQSAGVTSPGNPQADL